MVDSTKVMRAAILFVVCLTILSGIQQVAAYHGHNSFYDDPYYYGRGYNYGSSYYTHHQYHYVAYRNHYTQYNRYYYSPPPRYYRYDYRYPRCRYPGDVCY